MRLPLPTNLESRDGDLTQDAKIKNGYIDTEENSPNVVKRAGVTLIQTTGDGSIPNDIFVLDDVAYVWRESSPAGNPTVSRVYASATGFSDFEFDATAVAEPVEGRSIAAGIQLSNGTDIQMAAGVDSDKAPGVDGVSIFQMTFANIAGTVIYGSASVSRPFTDFSGHIEVKKEGGYFNMYVDGVATLSIENTFIPFTSPTLDSTEFGTATVTNLQFII